MSEPQYRGVLACVVLRIRRAHFDGALYAKWKTAEMCIGLPREKQQARHEWIRTGPRCGRTQSHVPVVITYTRRRCGR